MKGLAIYTIVLYGLSILAVALRFDSAKLIGLTLLIPVVIFAILYLVKSGKKNQP